MLLASSTPVFTVHFSLCKAPFFRLFQVATFLLLLDVSSVWDFIAFLLLHFHYIFVSCFKNRFFYFLIFFRFFSFCFLCLFFCVFIRVSALSAVVLFFCSHVIVKYFFKFLKNRFFIFVFFCFIFFYFLFSFFHFLFYHFYFLKKRKCAFTHFLNY